MTPKITIIDKLSPEDNAMLQALQSRSPASVEERLEKVRAKGSGSFMDCYYVGYGHQSIGDCGATTIFVEGCTMLQAKAIQDWPLYSGQESSTRYMDFSTAEFLNPDGSHRGEEIQETWRQFYIETRQETLDHLRSIYPRKDDEDENVYERALAARGFDVMRAFLPAGAVTNLSWSTNLRQANDKIQWLLMHPDVRTCILADNLRTALRSQYPSSFRHASTRSTEATYRGVVMRNDYFLTDVDIARRDDVVLTGIVQSELSPSAMRCLVGRPRGAEVPWFLAEEGMIRSSSIIDFGSYRDAQRHRAGITRMPLLTLELGFHPWYTREMAPQTRGKAIELLEKQERRIQTLACNKVDRQNYIAMGYMVPLRATQPLPAFIYRLELRSSKTIHPTYRSIVLKEIAQFKASFPDVPLYVDEDPDSWTVRRGTQTIQEKAP